MMLNEAFTKRASGYKKRETRKGGDDEGCCCSCPNILDLSKNGPQYAESEKGWGRRIGKKSAVAT